MPDLAVPAPERPVPGSIEPDCERLDDVVVHGPIHRPVGHPQHQVLADGPLDQRGHIRRRHPAEGTLPDVLADDEVSTSRRALGQVIEWLVWSSIVGHSERTTHVFLPLDDRGVDGIVRRVDDEAMCAVQVKGRTSIAYSEIRTVVRRTALDDPNITFVVALLDPVTITLGETVYVMDAEAVLRLGSPSSGPNGAEIELRLPYPPRPDSKWTPYACPLAYLATRLFPSAGVSPAPGPAPPPPAPPLAGPAIPAPPRQRELLGHLAELEVMRLLGEPPTLNTFKSFPDLEEAEYLVRHRPSGNIRGVQVKCLIVPDAGYHGGIDVHGPSFAPSPLTDIVVLAWPEDRGTFHDVAWIIPAIDVPGLVTTDRYTFRIPLRISDAKPTRFDRYRVARSDIPALLEARVAPAPSRAPTPRAHVMPDIALPVAVAHADWGVNPNKRLVATARLHEQSYTIDAPRLVGSHGTPARRMHVGDAPEGAVLLGFDFPIGLPSAYARSVGIDSFPGALDQFGAGLWAQFWDVAATEAEIGPYRPFYPMRPGGTSQAHLTSRLGLSMAELTRECERATIGGRRAACALFWTLGGNQVGKGALSGWREMLQPARRPDGGHAALWPFEGPLSQLIEQRRLVIAETYPTEFYGHLGVRFAGGAGGGKRSQAARAAQASALLSYTENAQLTLTVAARDAIETGFGAGSDGEDRFDAMVGLLGMLNIVLGHRHAGDPPAGAPFDVEGWILGQAR